MKSSDFFLTLGEIAVTLAGFASVVVVFKRRESGVWEPADLSRLRGMLGSSLSAAFFSMLPVGLHRAGVSESTAWSVSSLALACSSVAAVYFVSRLILSLPSSSFSRALALFMLASLALAALLLLLNAFAILLPGGPAAYIFTVLLMLVFSGVLFMRLVVLPLEE